MGDHSSVRFVLIQTFHPGNIGAAARAMKTMGHRELVLVNPLELDHPEVKQRAAGALDVIEQARVVSSLEEAIGDCQLVIGTSARSRNYDRPSMNARQAATHVAQESQSKTAVVFGRERMGMHNEELALCTHQLYIPANADYGILNMAAAVQVVAYELMMAGVSHTPIETDHAPTVGQHKSRQYPPQEDMSRFYDHLSQTLSRSGFLRQKHPGEAMARLQRLFNRARPEVVELNMLRGILRNYNQYIDRVKNPSEPSSQAPE